MNASKAVAAINGRDFVIPDDILQIAPPVLRHRIILSPDKEMEGVTEDAVIQQIIQSLDIPR
jgi:MoxR-like ATPase